jgi:hypothetical protein
MQRFCDSEKRFLRSDQLTSTGVKELCLHYATRLPFSEVSALTERLSGVRLLSEDSVWRLVQKEAGHLDEQQEQQIKESCNLPMPNFVALDDDSLYAATGEGIGTETVVFTDGICVKAQKTNREGANLHDTVVSDKPRQENQAKADKRHETDVMLVPRRDGSFAFVSEGVSGSWSIVEAARSFFRREWGSHTATIPLVAITDGARAIREDLSALFGPNVRVILDWYHLARRVYENLSMAAYSMKQREEWERQTLGFLWQGQSAEAIAFLSQLTARNAKALSALLGYLEKHASEIIDYGRRQKAAKPIGSGRMEKAVDQVIGLRQKDHGMSWTRKGSRALALLKVQELNARSLTA